MTAYDLQLLMVAFVALALGYGAWAWVATHREHILADRLPRPVQTRGDLCAGSTYDDYRDKWRPVDPDVARRIRDDIDIALWSVEMGGEDA